MNTNGEKGMGDSPWLEGEGQPSAPLESEGKGKRAGSDERMGW